MGSSYKVAFDTATQSWQVAGPTPLPSDYASCSLSASALAVVMPDSSSAVQQEQQQQQQQQWAGMVAMAVPVLLHSTAPGTVLPLVGWSPTDGSPQQQQQQQQQQTPASEGRHSAGFTQQPGAFSVLALMGGRYLPTHVEAVVAQQGAGKGASAGAERGGGGGCGGAEGDATAGAGRAYKVGTPVCITRCFGSAYRHGLKAQSLLHQESGVP